MENYSFPLWFMGMVADQTTIRNSFSKGFSGSDLPNDVDLSDLIEIFGRINQNQVASLLSDSLKGKYQTSLKTQQTRFQKIAAIVLDTLSQNKLLDLEQLKPYYTFSLFSAEDIEQSVFRELIEYLLSLFMPSQESRFLKCHAVKVIQTNLDEYQKELDDTITLLFKLALSHSQQQDVETLTLRQEQLIFKCAALKGYEKMTSWGNLFFIWLRSSKQGQLLSGKIQSTFRFDKLLIPIKKPDQQPAPATLSPLLFQEFVIEQTTAFVFQHPESLLPKGIAEELFKKIIAGSPRAQQDSVYYLDYLHHLPRTKSFPFEGALEHLQSLISDHSSPHYLFLLKCLIFFNCKFMLSLPIEQENNLFKEILLLDCDQMIKEEFVRKPPIYPLLMELVTKGRISLKECAHILFRSASTIPESSNPLPCPYLDFEGHLNFLNTIENNFGLRLPSHIIADFLFFQSAKSEISKVIESYIKIRSWVIDPSLKHLAIQNDIYQSWEGKSTELIGAIELNPQGTFPSYFHERLQAFPQHMSQLARLLQLASYPQPMAPISACMPIALERDCFKFNDEGNGQINCLAPFFSDLPSGPGRFCEWIFLPGSAKASFSVSLLNSVEFPCMSCSFQVPVNIPYSSDDQIAFFNLIGALVDTLGKEVLSEKEKKEWSKFRNEPYSLPYYLHRLTEKSAVIFDQFINRSPFLEEIWKKHESQLQKIANPVKSALFCFIKSYRFHLKKAFYTALKPDGFDGFNPDQKLTEAEDKDFSVIYLDNNNPKGLIDTNSCAQLISIFEKIFSKIQEQQSFTKIECNVLEKSLGIKFWISIKNFVEQRKEQPPVHQFLVSMDYFKEDKEQKLEIKYLPFKDKDQFVQLMLWQTNLVAIKLKLSYWTTAKTHMIER